MLCCSHHVLQNDWQQSLTAERFQQPHSDMQLKHPENHSKQWVDTWNPHWERRLYLSFKFCIVVILINTLNGYDWIFLYFLIINVIMSHRMFFLCIAGQIKSMLFQLGTRPDTAELQDRLWVQLYLHLFLSHILYSDLMLHFILLYRSKAASEPPLILGAHFCTRVVMCLHKKMSEHRAWSEMTKLGC